MALVGCRYIQATDPGTVGAGYEWYNTTTGVLLVRNLTNTAWEDPYSLLLPKAGGVMTGAITGVSGWAPLNDPNFTGTPKKLDINLATTADLATLQTSLTTLINDSVRSAVATYGSKLSISGNIVTAVGQLDSTTTAQTIPLPTFAGDRQAIESECKWIVSPAFTDQHDSGNQGGWNRLRFLNGSGAVVDPTTTRTLKLVYIWDQDGSYTGGKFSYMITATKSY